MWSAVESKKGSTCVEKERKIQRCGGLRLSVIHYVQNQLSKKISLIKKEARELNQDIIFNFTDDAAGVIVANKETNFVGLISVDEKEDSVGSFRVDIKKWEWAHAEGFTKDDMSSLPLRKSIFIPISINEFIKNLMGK